jgi:ABC-type transporter MlaC component
VADGRRHFIRASNRSRKPPLREIDGVVTDDRVAPATFKGSDPLILVEYRMYWRDSWKVIDVSIDGISIVQNYRSNFSSTDSTS